MKKKLISLQLFLLVLFYFPSISSAQRSNLALPGGHLLERITLLTDESESVLKLEGTFSLEKSSEIQVVQDTNASATKIILPHAFINHLVLKKRINFANTEIVEFIDVEEKVEKKAQGGAITFEVTLTIASPLDIRFLFDKSQSNSNQLVFAIQSNSAEILPVASTPQETSTELVPEPSIVTQQQKIIGMSNQETNRLLLHPVSAMLIYQRPLRLQLSILNASNMVESAQKLAILLERHQRRELENQLGMQLKITNISTVRDSIILTKTKIYYRSNYLDAALALAETIPGEQIVEKMPLDRSGRLGVDVEVFVGENFK